MRQNSLRDQYFVIAMISYVRLIELVRESCTSNLYLNILITGSFQSLN